MSRRLLLLWLTALGAAHDLQQCYHTDPQRRLDCANPIQSVSDVDVHECLSQCDGQQQCNSVNYDAANGLCHLYDIYLLPAAAVERSAKTTAIPFLPDYLKAKQRRRKRQIVPVGKTGKVVFQRFSVDGIDGSKYSQQQSANPQLRSHTVFFEYDDLTNVPHARQLTEYRGDAIRPADMQPPVMPQPPSLNARAPGSASSSSYSSYSQHRPANSEQARSRQQLASERRPLPDIRAPSINAHAPGNSVNQQLPRNSYTQQQPTNRQQAVSQQHPVTEGQPPSISAHAPGSGSSYSSYSQSQPTDTHSQQAVSHQHPSSDAQLLPDTVLQQQSNNNPQQPMYQSSNNYLRPIEDPINTQHEQDEWQPHTTATQAPANTYQTTGKSRKNPKYHTTHKQSEWQYLQQHKTVAQLPASEQRATRRGPLPTNREERGQPPGITPSQPFSQSDEANRRPLLPLIDPFNPLSPRPPTEAPGPATSTRRLARNPTGQWMPMVPNSMQLSHAPAQQAPAPSPAAWPAADAPGTSSPNGYVFSTEAPAARPSYPTPSPAARPAYPSSPPAARPAYPSPSPAARPAYPNPSPAARPAYPNPSPADRPAYPNPSPADRPAYPSPSPAARPAYPTPPPAARPSSFPTPPPANHANMMSPQPAAYPPPNIPPGYVSPNQNTYRPAATTAGQNGAFGPPTMQEHRPAAATPNAAGQDEYEHTFYHTVEIPLKRKKKMGYKKRPLPLYGGPYAPPHQPYAHPPIIIYNRVPGPAPQPPTTTAATTTTTTTTTTTAAPAPLSYSVIPVVIEKTHYPHTHAPTQPQVPYLQNLLEPVVRPPYWLPLAQPYASPSGGVIPIDSSYTDNVPEMVHPYHPPTEPEYTSPAVPACEHPALAFDAHWEYYVKLPQACQPDTGQPDGGPHEPLPTYTNAPYVYPNNVNPDYTYPSHSNPNYVAPAPHGPDAGPDVWTQVPVGHGPPAPPGYVPPTFPGYIHPDTDPIGHPDARSDAHPAGAQNKADWLPHSAHYNWHQPSSIYASRPTPRPYGPIMPNIITTRPSSHHHKRKHHPK